MDPVTPGARMFVATTPRKLATMRQPADVRGEDAAVFSPAARPRTTKMASPSRTASRECKSRLMRNLKKATCHLLSCPRGSLVLVRVASAWAVRDGKACEGINDVSNGSGPQPPQMC